MTHSEAVSQRQPLFYDGKIAEFYLHLKNGKILPDEGRAYPNRTKNTAAA